MVRWMLWRRWAFTTWVAVVVVVVVVHYGTKHLDSTAFEHYRSKLEARLTVYESQLHEAHSRLKDRDREFVALRGAAAHCVNDSMPFQQTISIPTFFDFLPHIYSGSLAALRPALSFPNETLRSAHIVIGIPTVARQNSSYLVGTLQSLISGMSEEEKSTCVIVVMIGDEDGADSQYAVQQLNTIRMQFDRELASSLLHVIVPPREWYPPDLHSVPPTFGDSQERMYWRTKQNLDYVFLMLYCQHYGQYYLQLEDDVVTKPGFLRRINEFIVEKSASTDWLMLEFSSLGFIGKLFRSSDLSLLTQFIVLFHREKPVDWLLDLLFVSRYCHPEKNAKQCGELTKQFRVRARPSVFQHVGVYSSLAGKVQKLRERDFGKAPLFVAHPNNPSAQISTSLVKYKHYDLEDAYAGRNFFWSLAAHAQDYILIDFSLPVKLQGFLFRSGHPEHPNDIFDRNASVYMRAAGASEFEEVISFNEAGLARFVFNESVSTGALKIEVHEDSTHWHVLSEISIEVDR